MDAIQRTTGPPTVRLVLAIHSDGRLLCMVGAVPVAGGDADVVAGTISAIRSSVAAGLAGAGELQDLRLEQETVAFETAGDIVLAAGVVGGDRTRAHLLLREWLDEIEPRFRSIVSGWDGQVDSLRPLEDDLQRRIGPTRPVGAPA